MSVAESKAKSPKQSSRKKASPAQAIAPEVLKSILEYRYGDEIAASARH